MRRTGTGKGRLCGVLALTLLVAGSSAAQGTWGKQTLKRGKLWESIWNSLQYGDPTETENGFHTLDYPGYSKGTSVNDALNYAEAGGYAIYGVRENVAYSYTINSRFFPSLQDIFPIEEATLTQNYNLRDIGVAGEEIVTGAHHVNGLNVDVVTPQHGVELSGAERFRHPRGDDHQQRTLVGRFGLYFGMRYGLRITQRSGSRRRRKIRMGLRAKQSFYFHDD